MLIINNAQQYRDFLDDTKELNRVIVSLESKLKQLKNTVASNCSMDNKAIYENDINTIIANISKVKETLTNKIIPKAEIDVQNMN